jgi:hypothetical protein
MKTRLKIILLNQYIGAIAIGFLVARAIEVFVGAFMPAFNALITQWLTGTDMGKQYWSETVRGSMISNLVITVLFLLIAYAFASWLYGKPAVESTAGMDETDRGVENVEQQ